MIAQLDHLNLSVANFEETAGWYHRIFGFEVVEKGFIEGKPWGVIKAGDAMLCIYEQPERTPVDRYDLDEQKLHGFNHFAIRLQDADAWKKIAAAENLTFNYGGPISWPHSTSWYVSDPTGYEIEIVLWHENGPKFDEMA